MLKIPTTEEIMRDIEKALLETFDGQRADGPNVERLKHILTSHILERWNLAQWFINRNFVTVARQNPTDPCRLDAAMIEQAYDETDVAFKTRCENYWKDLDDEEQSHKTVLRGPGASVRGSQGSVRAPGSDRRRSPWPDRD